MIEVNKISFSYGKSLVLKDISFQLEDGKIYGLLGENGVGKTTLLTLLSGLKVCQEGTINVDGFKPFDRKPSFLSNQYFLSDDVAPVNMSAIAFAKNYGKFWVNFSLDKFKEIMQLFDNDLNQNMSKMSAGQLKKSYIAFALACDCKYLYMDEPTNGLDIPSKALFRKALLQYVSENSTVLISTHQVRDLENVIDPIIILDNKDVLLNATVDEISQKLYFDYSNTLKDNALYKEITPGGSVQVLVNQDSADSKVNLEALFNAVQANKTMIKEMFNNK